MLDKVKPASQDINTVLEQFLKVRKLTEELCVPLELEDYNLQTVAETSPVKWHLAHTTWFFETFILKEFEPDFVPYHSQYGFLFNSYYNAVGEQFSRAKRHLLSRPTVSQVMSYREVTSNKIVKLVQSLEGGSLSRVLRLVLLGINHEQQHQELLLTDLKYNLFQNPMMPSPYSEDDKASRGDYSTMNWLHYDGGLTTIGVTSTNEDGADFCFDNESPAHQCYLEPFKLSHRLITNAEYIEFIEAGGYQCSDWWLSDGWDEKCRNNWSAPLYWFKKGAEWYQYTLTGTQAVRPNEPVCHISYYEADAFATWFGARLPTEQEWESVAQSYAVQGSFLNSDALMPHHAGIESNSPQQLFGELWQWTSSSYSPYPGYQAPEGAVGEYNGKFMVNQYILRGGSCVSSRSHLRPTYRNFFYPNARWQYTGIRLAKTNKG